MTVEQEIAMLTRIKARLAALDPEKRKELKAAMNAAAAKSARVAEEIAASGGFTPENRAAFNAANLEYEQAAKAYYGE